VTDPSANDWERAYHESVHREDERAKAAPGYESTAAMVGLRFLLLIAGVVALTGWFVGRMLGFGGMGLFWISFGVAFMVGVAVWWRRQ
jgi:hypothetical protein